MTKPAKPASSFTDAHPLITTVLCLLALTVVVAGLWALVAFLVWLACQPILFILWIFANAPI